MVAGALGRAGASRRSGCLTEERQRKQQEQLLQLEREPGGAESKCRLQEELSGAR